MRTDENSSNAQIEGRLQVSANKQYYN